MSTSVSEDRKARYEWDEDGSMEVREVGKGESIDLVEYLARLNKDDTAPTKRATDEDGPATLHSDMQLYHGLPVRIETPAGATRTGLTDEGESWSITMTRDYGFIEGFDGADGDSLDCYVGPHPESSAVFVVDQYDLNGEKFDEHKVIFGHHAKDSALETYMDNHHRSATTFAAITEFSMPMFRRWMATHDMAQPCESKI